MAVLEFKVKLAPQGSKDPEVLRVTRVTAVSVALKVFAVRRDCLGLVVLVVTREIKVSVAHLVNLVLVACLEFKENLGMLVVWVLVVLVACLVSADCREALVNAVHVVVLALLAHAVHEVLLEKLERWG